MKQNNQPKKTETKKIEEELTNKIIEGNEALKNIQKMKNITRFHSKLSNKILNKNTEEIEENENIQNELIKESENEENNENEKNMNFPLQ